MANAPIAALTEPTEAAEILKLLDDLHPIHVYLPNLIGAALTLIGDQDDMEEVRSVLSAALRYCSDVYSIAEEIEIAARKLTAKGIKDTEIRM